MNSSESRCSSLKRSIISFKRTLISDSPINSIADSTRSIGEICEDGGIDSEIDRLRERGERERGETEVPSSAPRAPLRLRGLLEHGCGSAVSQAAPTKLRAHLPLPTDRWRSSTGDSFGRSASATKKKPQPHSITASLRTRGAQGM